MEKKKKISAKEYRRHLGFDLYYKEKLEEYGQSPEEFGFIEKIKVKIDRVMFILIRNPMARDSYKVLMAEYLNSYFKYNPEAWDSVYQWMLDPNFPEYNTILRSRTLLQEDFKELRGKHYDDRKRMASDIAQGWYTEGVRTI